jgi:hypothetical protein
MTPFSSEEAMRRWLIERLIPLLAPTTWMPFYGKNISDIVVFKQDQHTPLMLFVEAKYHKAKHGRIPIGGAGGVGYQPEYLLRKPDYLERYLRWIVVDEVTEQCVWLTNDEVRQHSTNGIAIGKHNNIKTNVFENPKVRHFLLADAPKHVSDWIKSQ